jgi:hypothetical protein
MTPKERGELFKCITIRRQTGNATQEDDIELQKIQETVDRQAERLIPAVLLKGGTWNDAIKGACAKLGLPGEFFRK